MCTYVPEYCYVYETIIRDQAGFPVFPLLSLFVTELFLMTPDRNRPDKAEK